MIIENVTPEKLAKLRAELMNGGASITGATVGKISGHGIEANYRYDESAQRLAVDLVLPFWMPESVIESKLREACS